MKKASRKKELLDIAYHLFLTQGYESTSIDEIVQQANIAKGTYYYYFKSKEQTLEEVVHMMIDNMANKASSIAATSLSFEQKIIGIIMAFQPDLKQQRLNEVIHMPENIAMHDKMNKRVINEAVPILANVIQEADREGIINCKDNIEERMKIILILSRGLFDEGDYSIAEIALFIEIAEYLLGAKKGSLAYIKKLIDNSDFTEKGEQNE